MKTYKIKDMVKGWFIGNFEPSVLKTNHFEIAYRKMNDDQPHFHKKGYEVTLVVSGKIDINGTVFSAGDIFVIEPNEVSNSKIIEMGEIVAIRNYSDPDDKHYV